ncbi:SUMF1/EgtB/PvdO family nonheme iron enzyme [Allomuricauda taeanensis]|uniref:formylglycine-generating enzyme family protein n=1 Tax=Flagellimonas taeanensis TaxID=1005926 RepID=UPI002E7B6BED|nr:SUMF1/EgtB/PvdO family nonheme iron enzyme [Allomuricauda taeanensis]MEE1963939.1 SUMF1/EgtB/PvdO family nonheme iron enzyme [Allomuricauda taeanensis]
MNKIPIIIFLAFIPLNSFSQETVARFKYEDAEKAFVAANYQECIDNLEEAEKLLGKTAPNILHLKITAQYRLFEQTPYESYEALENLRNNCNIYLANYDIAGLEEKYRDVYDISIQLPVVSSSEQFEQQRSQYRKELEEASLKRAIEGNNLVFVEGGTYVMGEKKEAHEVIVSDFYMGKYEVTLGKWNTYLEATGRTGDNNVEYKAYINLTSYNDRIKFTPHSASSAFYRHVGVPHGNYVTKVLWEEMMAYCKWLESQHGGTWRLPTEAEWEYAVRNGNKTGGEARYDEKELSSSNIKEQEPTVGKFSPNVLGLYDMPGNVRELCYDYYDKDYFSHSPKENPMGPDNGERKVVRGVSRSGSGIFRRAGAGTLAATNISIGFRVVYIPN